MEHYPGPHLMWGAKAEASPGAGKIGDYKLMWQMWREEQARARIGLNDTGGGTAEDLSGEAEDASEITTTATLHGGGVGPETSGEGDTDGDE
jgi:hypothetical protein